MATFSDCMTLLLTFFVLLVSFSSYDEGALQMISGAFDCRPLPTLFDGLTRVDDSLAYEEQASLDRTDAGDEMNSADMLEENFNPKAHEPVVDRSAYDEEKLFYVPSRRLFAGRGSALTRQGRDYLASLAFFMQAIPCKVVVGVADPLGAEDRSEAGGSERALAVVEFFTQDKKLPAERFRISAVAAPTDERFRHEQVVTVTLMMRDIVE